MNSDTKSRNAFSLSQLSSYLPRLISPLSWWHCFHLLYYPFAHERSSSKNFFQFSFRLSTKSLKFIALHITLLILVALWCYIYWMLVFDAGQYFTLLSRISSNQTNITDARSQFNQILWRTALKTLGISINFGVINACAVTLAALWRERLCKEFYKILFR